MADIETGYTFTPGAPNNEVTASTLNEALNSATIQAEFVTGKPEKTAPVDDDVIVIVDSVTGQFRKVKRGNMNPDAPALTGYRGLRIANKAGSESTAVDLTVVAALLRSGAGDLLRVENVSLTANIALGVALNGLDAGSEAASTWYYLWLISDGTNARCLLSTADGAAAQPALPGAYSFKLLLGVVRNDGSSNFARLLQLENRVAIAPAVIFTAKAGVAAYAALAGADLTAMQAAIPPIARSVSGTIGSVAGSTKASAIASDANGLGEVNSIRSGGGAINSFGSAGFFRVSLAATQNLQWLAEDTSSNYRLVVSGYEL